jgi:uncharacterized protein YndB with AHSA1/START domain
MKTSASVTIDATVQQVWDVLTDDDKLHLWSAGYPLITYPEGERRADPTGQQFILTFPQLPRPSEMHGEFLAFSPPNQLAVRCQQHGHEFLVVYTLQSRAQVTDLVVTSEPRLASPTMQFLEWLSTPLRSWMMRSSLMRLKRLVEKRA